MVTAMEVNRETPRCAAPTVENQLQELRKYAVARGWTKAEYIGKGVSGAKDGRPALDRLVADAKRRGFDAWWSGALVASDAI